MLKPNEDGSELILVNPHQWAMQWKNMEITNPSWSECGRFFVSPAYYGFYVYESGGGCTGWRKDFGDWHMFITCWNDASHRLEIDEPVTIGVYDNKDSWACWNMKELDYLNEFSSEGNLLQSVTLPK